MIVTIYADSTGVFTEDFTNGVTNLINVEVAESDVRQFYEEEVYEADDDVYPTDEDFDVWINEYTADDTTELWEWCERYGVECRINEILTFGF